MDRIKTYTLAKPYWLKINFERSHLARRRGEHSWQELGFVLCSNLSLISTSLSKATAIGKIFLEKKSYFLVQILQNTFESQALERILCWQQIHHIFFYARTIMHNGTRAGVSLVFYEVIPVLLLSSSVFMVPLARTAANALFFEILYFNFKVFFTLSVVKIPDKECQEVNGDN